MILNEAIDAAKKESRVQKKKPVYVVLDDEGECEFSLKAKAGATSHAFLNGQEIPVPNDNDIKAEGKAPKTSTKPGKVSPKKPTAKPTAVSKEGENAEVMKNKKQDRKPAKKAAKKSGMPEGKKMTLTVAKALALAKGGASLYRASNGSPLGAYYLGEYKNKEKEIEFIVSK